MRTDMKAKLVGLVFILPAIALFCVFVVYPIVFNIQASTLDWDGVNVGTFVGLGNYPELFQDPVFVKTLRNSLWWIVLTIIPQCFLGFFLAYMLDGPLRGRTIYRVVFFLPTILSPVVVGIVWKQILDPANGVFAQIGRSVGAEWMAQPWLSSPSTAIFAAIFVNVWMWTGFSMLFYLAGLQLVDPAVIEAAMIDGANARQLVVHIIWPLLKPTHISLVLLGIIGSLKTFELVYMLTEGGPNHASEMMPTYIFQEAFRQQNVGYASTISVVLLVVAMAASLSMMRVFGSGFITGDDR